MDSNEIACNFGAAILDRVERILEKIKGVNTVWGDSGPKTHEAVILEALGRGLQSIETDPLVNPESSAAAEIADRVAAVRKERASRDLLVTYQELSQWVKSESFTTHNGNMAINARKLLDKIKSRGLDPRTVLTDWVARGLVVAPKGPRFGDVVNNNGHSVRAVTFMHPLATT